MRSYRTCAAFLSAAFCWAIPVDAQAPQSPNNPVRDFGGWRAVPGTSNAGAQVKQAHFQAPGGGPADGSLPSLPSGFGPGGFGGAALPEAGGAPPNLPGTSSLSDDSNLGGPMGRDGVVYAGGPAGAYDQFSNPDGRLPATDVRQASGSGLRDVTQANAPLYPNQNYAQPNQTQPVYPPQTGGQMPPDQSPQSHLRSIGPSNAAQQRQMHNGTEYSIPVVSQDPRFISPPPAPRVGNYATSPYTGSAFRTVSYQVNQQVPARTVQAQVGQTAQPATVANTALAPQYQPVIGVHQTNYQQCGPNIPVGGVPAVVPGAVAPPTLPPNLTPQIYTPNNAGFKPLFSLGQENYNVLLGRGIIGQPTVYVPGQPFRNFFRYISP